MEGGQYILEGEEDADNTTIIFSMSEEVGALANALKSFQVRLLQVVRELLLRVLVFVSCVSLERLRTSCVVIYLLTFQRRSFKGLPV